MTRAPLPHLPLAVMQFSLDPNLRSSAASCHVDHVSFLWMRDRSPSPPQLQCRRAQHHETKRVAVSTEANQRLAELVDESSKKKTALSEATNEVKAAQAAQKTAKEAQINGQIEFQQAAGKMAALEKLMSDHFEPLKEGSLQSKAAIKTSVEGGEGTRNSLRQCFVFLCVS